MDAAVTAPARRGDVPPVPQNLTLPTIHVTARADLVAVALRLAHADDIATEHATISRETGEQA